MNSKPVGALVCVLLVSVIPLVSGFNNTTSSQIQPADSYEEYSEIQMLPDVELDGTYTFEESDYFDSFEANALDSVVELLWSHSDGNRMVHTQTTDMTNNLPVYEDYVAVSESFSWDYNVLPSQVSALIDYGVFLAGDFDSVTFPVLFTVYVWLIDSSGEWTRIYSSNSGLPASHISVNIQVSYTAITRAWSGMIQNDNGIQTDPTDTLRFALGLGPANAFTGSLNEYWDWMNGAVQVLVDTMSLTCVVNTNPDEEAKLAPDFVGTSGTLSNDITADLAITEAGSIYTVGTTYYETEPFTMTLTKWTDVGAVVWTRSIQGQESTYGHGVAISESAVVAVGASAENNGTDTHVAKWNHQGTLLWSKAFDFGNVDFGQHVDISYDGSIFVIGHRREGYGGTAYLAKITSDGTLVWSVDCGYPFSDYPRDIAVAIDGYIYTATQQIIAKWDVDGNQEWNRTGVFSSVKVTREGNLYTTNLFPPRNLLQQWNSNGTRGWNISLTYNHVYFGEIYLYPTLLGVTPAGWAYVHLSASNDMGKFILAIFDTEGVQLWNQTLDPEFKGHPYYNTGYFAVGVHSSGFVCFAPSIQTTRGDFDNCILLYLSDRQQPIISTPLTIIVIAVAIVIMIAIPFDFIRRKRSVTQEDESFDWMATQVYLPS